MNEYAFAFFRRKFGEIPIQKSTAPHSMKSAGAVPKT